jgi:hypothetical protein
MIQFTADPTNYSPWAWQKRQSVHQHVGGGITIQDFGTTMKDQVIEIRGELEQFMENAVVAQIHALFRAKGAVYRLTDWLGNDLTVFLEEFQPVPHPQLPGCTYTLRCRIMGIAQLFGSAYSE